MNPAAADRRLFAIGDIHGCLDKLNTLIDRLPGVSENDVLIFLGDYIGRGTQTSGVIQRLLAVKEQFPHTVFLMGNHEHSLLEYARTGEPAQLQILRQLGVEATLDSYGSHSSRSLRDLSFLPDAHRVFLQDLLPYCYLDRYLFIHAGIIPGEDPATCPLDRLLTVRHRFLSHPEPMDITVVFGHTPFETPFVTEDKIGIDTGAVYGNLLTAVELPRLRFYHG
jgi:serine/threonine protein phosphatase 1